MIEVVLDYNNFSLDMNRQFVQTEGTAIGSRLGRNYACTYLGQWERQLLDSSDKKNLKPFLDSLTTFLEFGATVKNV